MFEQSTSQYATARLPSSSFATRKAPTPTADVFMIGEGVGMGVIVAVRVAIEVGVLVAVRVAVDFTVFVGVLVEFCVAVTLAVVVNDAVGVGLGKLHPFRALFTARTNSLMAT